MNIEQVFGGFKIVTSPLLTISGRPRRTTRAWRQRRRGGRGGVAVLMVPTRVPDPNALLLHGDTLVLHPDTFARLRSALPAAQFAPAAGSMRYGQVGLAINSSV